MAWLVKRAEHAGEIAAILNGLTIGEAASAKIVSSTGYRDPYQQPMSQEMPPNSLMPMPSESQMYAQSIGTTFYVFYNQEV